MIPNGRDERWPCTEIGTLLKGERILFTTGGIIACPYSSVEINLCSRTTIELHRGDSVNIDGLGNHVVVPQIIVSTTL